MEQLQIDIPPFDLTLTNVFTVKNGFKFGIGFALGSTLVYAAAKIVKAMNDDSQK